MQALSVVRVSVRRLSSSATVSVGVETWRRSRWDVFLRSTREVLGEFQRELTGPASGSPPPTSSAGTVVRDVLVGRDEDCAALDDLARTVRGGLSRSLVIIGEPGIGKTRLLQYAARGAGREQTVRVVGMQSETLSLIHISEPTRRTPI